MSRYTPQHRRPRQAGAAVAASVVLAAGLVPLAISGSASAAVLLPGPTVASPTSETTVLKEVVLDWAPVTGATRYVVQLGTDELWSDEPTLELATVATRLTVPTSLPHATYVWRVAAVGADGQGRWSANGTFTRAWSTTPSPLAPVGDVPSEVGVPTFRWTPVPTASEYQVQVSTSPYFDAPFRTQAGVTTESCFTTQTQVTPFNGQAGPKTPEGGAGDCVFTLLLTGEQRYWRVRALDHVVDGAAEVNTTPVVDEGISSQPPQPMDELDTSACPAAPVPYDPYAPSPSPSASASASPAASASPTPSASPSAAPTAGGGCEPAHTVEKGAWSQGVGFSHALPDAPDPVPFYDDLVNSATNTAGMAAPTLDGQTCAANVCRDFPTLSWTEVPGAQWYRLYVALDAGFTNIHEIVETPARTWTPTHQWRESNVGAAYHVVVQPCTTSRTEPTEQFPDGRGPGCDEPSAPLSFKKSSPAVAPVFPADGARTAGGEQLLRWQPFSEALAARTGKAATSEAYAYRLQVTTAANPDFLSGGLVEDVTVDVTHHVSPAKTYGNGEFLWRVQPVDASGHKLPWSPVRSFLRDAIAPSFTVSPTSRLAISSAVKVAFSEPVTGVSASSVSISGVPTTLTVAADGRSATLKPTKPLLPGARHAVVVTAAVKDLSGNAAVAKSTTITVDPLVDDRSSAVVLGGSWTRLSSTNAVNRTWTRSVPLPTRKTTATVSLVGRGVEVKGCVGPANGLIELWVDGALLKRIDTHRTSSACGVVLTRTAFPTTKAVHVVQFRGIGVKRAVSKGTAVGLDALTALP